MKKTIPITRPTLEPYARYAPMLRRIIESRMLTNSSFVKEFERKTAAYLGVKHSIAVSSCTAGLMLVLKGLDLKGEVIMPSFTFSASGHPVLWNGLRPVFADIKPDTFEIDPRLIERLITKRTCAILATHVFGVPCDTRALRALAKKHNLKLIFDAAHAFGSSRDGVRVGNFGDAEVFSCSPTKVLTAGEGGIIATDNDALAEFCRRGRNYGDDGSFDEAFAGLSARMSEFHAVVGLRSLARLTANLKRRRSRAEYFKKKMLNIEPRLRFQRLPEGVETTYKDLSLFIDTKSLGYTRDDLNEYFKENGIVTRKYFHPPLHRHAAYCRFKGALPVTDLISANVLSLPLYSDISTADIDRIVRVFATFIYERKKS